MPSKRPNRFEQKVARIRAIRADAPGSASRELTELLADPEPYIAGAAADAVAELGLRACIPDLAAALLRVIGGSQPDTGCIASDKIVDALSRLEADEAEAYRAGLRYVRKERSGPGLVDRAISVRIHCAMGLARHVRRGTLLDIVPLLADPEAPVRAGVARAMGLLHGDGPAAVLHLKWLEGDAEAPEVLGACLEGLLALDPKRFLPLAERALDDDRIAEHAALALGESRLDEALSVFRRALDTTADSKRRGLLLLCVALLRTSDAIAFLFDVLDDAPVTMASHAVHALAVHRHTSGIAERVRAAVARRRSKPVDEAFAAAFAQKSAPA